MKNLYMDPAAANRLRELILERLQRNANSPGIYHKKGKYEEVYRFLAGDRVFVEVQVHSRRANSLDVCHLTLIDGPDVPAAGIIVDGDTIYYSGRSHDQYHRVLASIEGRLSTGLIPLKLHVPYGYVQDGVIIAIFFSRLLKGNVDGALRTGASEYALRGHDLPAPLLARKGDTAVYVQTLDELVESGSVIELGERVVSPPGGLWFVSSNVGWPYLIFNKEDSRVPLLPAHVPYYLHLASDWESRDLPRTRKVAAAWLQAGRPPVNLSDFFAEFL